MYTFHSIIGKLMQWVSYYINDMQKRNYYRWLYVWKKRFHFMYARFECRIRTDTPNNQTKKYQIVSNEVSSSYCHINRSLFLLWNSSDSKAAIWSVFTEREKNQRKFSTGLCIDRNITRQPIFNSVSWLKAANAIGLDVIGGETNTRHQRNEKKSL